MVTDRDDPEPGACEELCSLREAVLAANANDGPDTVRMPMRRNHALSLPSSGEDAGLDGDLDVTGPLVIEHPGRGRATLDILNRDRGFEVSGPSLVLRKVQVQFGRARPDDGGDGGGVFAGPGSDVRLIGSNLYATVAPEGRGGGVFAAPGSRVRIVNGWIAGGASVGGGAIAAAPGSRVEASRSLFVKGSGRTGGAVLAEGEVAIDSTSIGGGGAMGGGRRATVDGGAIFAGSEGTLALTNSTLYLNSAIDDGGAVYAAPGAEVGINASTIARNMAARPRGGPDGTGAGGGIFQAAGASVSVANSIVALNTAGEEPSDCASAGSATVASGGSNLLSTFAGGCAFDRPADLVAADPGLAKRSGQAATIPLRRGSPAIDAAGQGVPRVDQRGRERDERPDIGAFEFGARR